jgi:hypothetical protein
MPDATLHLDNDTPKASDSDIKRCDADTPNGAGNATRQAIGHSPTAVDERENIQNAPKTPSRSRAGPSRALRRT